MQRENVASKLGLGRFHFDGDADGRHDLGGGIHDHMAADHALVVPSTTASIRLRVGSRPDMVT